MSKSWIRILALSMTLALALVAVACDSDDDSDSGDNGDTEITEVTDYEAIGLWDDGACDESLDTLKIGLMTVFQSEVLSLEDQALALEASAEAFNARGGAGPAGQPGACIEITTCDDGGNAEQAVTCVRTVDEAGVVATVNDQGTEAQAEVSEAMADAGIPRVASNVTSSDWGDQNAFPLDASGTGVTFLMPQGLIDQDITEIAIVRVDFAAAAVLVDLMQGTYEGEATFPVDIPVPAGTTDFTQFITAAESGGATGMTLAIGENEAIQVVRAGQQLDTELQIGGSLGSFAHSTVSDLGDFAENMVFLWSYMPATYDLAVYDALREDLANSGVDSLQPANLKASPMRSWIGLYALLYMIREAGLTDFTRENITTLLEESGPVPMLGMFGDEDWVPDQDHPGAFSRAGTNHWASWRWDPEADAPYGLKGNFVQSSEIVFDDVLCGSPFGGPEPC